jgi:hypothetical protein
MSRYRHMLTLLQTPLGKLRLLGIVALLGIVLFSVEAISRKFGGSDIVGLSSTTSNGCSCHGTSSTSTTLSATSATGSWTVETGSTTNFTVNVSNASQSSAGTNIAVKTTSTGSTNAGTLSVATGSGLQVVSSEITHNAPKALSSGTAAFTFSWTAPSTHGKYYLQAAGNAVNDNNANTGDSWNHMTAQEITVAGITLTGPNGGSTYCAGNSISIGWTSTAVTNVKIELSSDGGSSWPTTINASVGSGTNGTGTYSWSIPTNQAAGTNYRVRVSDAANSSRADASDASFSIATAPAITTQPTAQTVCSGDPVSFSVVATGSGLAYQWRRNGTAISGATSATYSIPATAVGDAASYDVQVSNPCSTATSTAVNLTVNTAPAITTQPTAQTACVGQPATFTVQATGTNLTYQWRKAGAPISGATTASYTIPTVSAGDAANYDVVISGTCTPTRTSNAVALTVRDLPAITSQPTAMTVCAGQPASFSVSATGAGLTYQWRRNGAAIAGAVGSTYSIGSASTANAGSYDVVVTGACSPAVTSNPVTLTVNPSPVFSSEPLSQVACEGQPVTLTAAASGTGVTYRWRHNGVDIAGATTASYTITAVGSDDLGAYDVVATTGDCFSISNSALLGMLRPASITGQPTDKSAVVGSTIELAVTASGDDLLYQWKKNGSNLAGETSARLQLVGIQTSAAGTYTVEVRNACTTLTSAPATVTVLQAGAGAVLSLTPSTVDFGAARVGVQQQRTITGLISNAGDSVLTITAATLGGSSDFAFTPLSLPMSIPPGESRPMTVRFTPSSVGAKTATISFTSNSKAAATLSLLGRGAVGSLTTTSPSIGVGRVAPGSTRDTTIELCNNSEIAVGVTAVAFGGSQAFTVVAPASLPVSVEPGACLSVTIRFAPTADGDVNDVLTITTDGEPANVTIGFSGTGGAITAAPIESAIVESLRAMPNPSTDGVTITMTLARPQAMDVVIVDARGAIVRRFVTTESAGEHRFTWNGRNEGGVRVAAGTYRVVARAGAQVTTTPIVIVR